MAIESKHLPKAKKSAHVAYIKDINKWYLASWLVVESKWLWRQVDEYTAINKLKAGYGLVTREQVTHLES
jgi:hypothetical protein